MGRGKKSNRAITSLQRTLGMVVLLLAASTGQVFAQAVNAGEIRGTVTDPAGAMVPGVNIAILNTATGVRTEVVTNESGIYDALSILPGNYTVTFAKEGFAKLVRQGIDLRIQVITLNAQLTVGASSQSVEVTAQASLLRTEGAEQGATLQSDVISQLPNVGQNWTNFTQTLPGVTGSGTNISVNGAQHYEMAFYADGGNVILPRSNNMDYLSNFESIEQVEIITSNFNAQYGSGTAVFNQISKSGTNRFHGSLYEFNQNNFFNARSYFQKEVGRTRWNNFGGSVGGPVRKDKLFFYFNYDTTRSRSASQGFTTYPTADMRNGDFSYAGFMNGDGTPRLIYDPNSLGANNQRTVYPGNKIPQTSLDPLAKKIQAFMPMPNTVAGVLDSHYVPLPNQAGVISNNYYYTRMGISHPYKYMFKVDYNVTPSNRLSASATRSMNITATDKTFNELWPLNINDGRNAALTGQITDVWTINATTVNEFRASLIRQSIRNTPASKNKGLISQLGISYALADVFPSVNIGGPLGGVGLNSGTSATMGDYTYAPSDTITFVRGRHIIKAGGQYERNGDNGGDWGDINPATYNFNPTFTASAPGNSTSGLGYADFLTGQVSGWSAKLSPVVGIRMRAAQMFVQDDFKIKSNLTLSFGLRYEIQGGWGEIGNRLASFDPTIINPATNTPGAMWYAGNNGRNTLQKTVYNTVLPRIGFAWTPQPKWSVRGAFGVFSYRWGADVYAVSAVRNPTAFYTTGNQSEVLHTTPLFILSDPNPLIVRPISAGGTLFIPSSATRTPAALNGQGVADFPYDTPASKEYSWSFAVQRELPQEIVAEMSYVGNTAVNLSFPRDLNQLPESKLGQGNPAKPYPNFQSVGATLFDGASNYHSLQMALRKRFSKGLSLDANYTWSKNLNNVDSGGHADTTLGGNRMYQRAYNPDINYGLSTSDVPQMFKVISAYELPMGRGKKLLAHGGPLDLLFGGWRASGVFIKQSGFTFMPSVSGTNLSGQLYGGTWYPNRTGSGVLSDPTISKWFDTTAFAIPASNTFGNSGRNVLRGPGRTTLDFSMGKNFGLFREGMQLQLRFDANNVLNHTVFSNPNASIGSTSAGIISGTAVGGRFLQLGARLQF